MKIIFSFAYSELTYLDLKKNGIDCLSKIFVG